MKCGMLYKVFTRKLLFVRKTVLGLIFEMNPEVRVNPEVYLINLRIT